MSAFMVSRTYRSHLCVQKRLVQVVHSRGKKRPAASLLHPPVINSPPPFEHCRLDQWMCARMRQCIRCDTHEEAWDMNKSLRPLLSTHARQLPRALLFYRSCPQEEPSVLRMNPCHAIPLAPCFHE